MSDFSSTFTISIRKKILLLLSFCAFFCYKSVANQAVSEHETAKTEKHGGYESKEDEPIGKKISSMILGHIGDNHSWDAFGHHVIIPLPVILYTQSGGLQFFSSARFDHGHAEYNGYKLINDGAKIVWADANNNEKIYDFSLTKIACTLILAAIFIIWLFVSMAKMYTRREGKAPRGLNNLLESLTIFIRDTVIKPSVGVKYEKYMPLLLTIFWFILIVNLLGQIPFFPGGANATGNIAIPLVLAGTIMLYVTVKANKYFWKHIFLPDVPVAMYIIMVPIEILGFFLRPFVLMLRLFANITAGHIIILGFFSLIFIFGSMQQWVGYVVSPASIAFNIFMGLMELLVAFLQAYVFTLLSSLYIGMAIDDHGHAAHEEAHGH